MPPKFLVLSPQQTREFAERYGIAEFAVRFLHSTFQQLDVTHSGLVNEASMAQTPIWTMGFMTQRVFQIFARGRGALDFISFLQWMALWLKPGNLTQKSEVLFDIMDLGNRGRIGKEDLLPVAKLLVPHATDAEVDEMVDNCFKEVQCDSSDMLIDLPEFQRILTTVPDIEDKLVLNLSTPTAHVHGTRTQEEGTASTIPAAEASSLPHNTDAPIVTPSQAGHEPSDTHQDPHKRSVRFDTPS
eukprot:GILK01009274.1.p1 GENE.GILK01009274.1~~GILK01009274.1.p1  ORF type:complete len:243 (-),score=32.46 GILK01009274.1:146-874(-)